MAPDFQSSFIPKEPVSNEVFKKKKAGIFGILAVSLFICSLVIAGALTLYKKMVKDEIQNLQSELAQSEKNIDKDAIDNILRFNTKLGIIKTVFEKHQAVSNVINSLASSTVKSVYYTEFAYGGTSEDKLNVIVSGLAPSYGAIALQEDVLKKNKDFSSMIFSDLQLAEDGRVSFKITISVDPKASIYVPKTLPGNRASASTTSSSAELDNIANDLEGVGLDDIETDISI